MNITQQVYRQTESIYKQYFRADPPKYFKYFTIAFGGVGLIVIRQIFWKLINKLRSYPPGPVGVPFLGCLIQFGATPRKFLVNVASYGPIAYVPLLTSGNLFISDPKALRKLYQKEKILDRPYMRFRRMPSITELSGHEWSKRRKFISITVLNLTNS